MFGDKKMMTKEILRNLFENLIKKDEEAIKVKGIELDKKEYQAFVQYLNDFKVNEFTQEDVINFLSFYYEGYGLIGD